MSLSLEAKSDLIFAQGVAKRDNSVTVEQVLAKLAEMKANAKRKPR